MIVHAYFFLLQHFEILNESIHLIIIILKIFPKLLTNTYFYLGCGNGKYLNVNHSIFKVGVDRCKRFTDIAREKENEVNTYIYIFYIISIIIKKIYMYTMYTCVYKLNGKSDIGNRFLCLFPVFASIIISSVNNYIRKMIFLTTYIL